jgi:hypothetical protein
LSVFNKEVHHSVVYNWEKTRLDPEVHCCKYRSEGTSELGNWLHRRGNWGWGQWRENFSLAIHIAPSTLQTLYQVPKTPQNDMSRE